MSLPPDYHMHTPLCRHATGEPLEFAAHAIAAGLAEIGFSDHNPMMEDDFDDWRMRLGQLDEYIALVGQARSAQPSLRIAIGLELDYLPGQEDWIVELAGRHQWDYLIGSVHYIESGWDIDNPSKLARWENRDVAEVWSAYYDRLTRAAESRLFDIIGHVDLCKKFGFSPREDFMPVAQRFLEAAASHGVAIEINTAGLRKPCHEMYPSHAILETARRLRVPITFGSDAHAPEEVGADFDRALALAINCGYTHSLRFVGRRARAVRL